MNRLMISKVNYIGKNYYYNSPEFDNGLNIVTGRNGAGKSTLSELIYYALGGTVLQFRKDHKEAHREIVEDSDNYVELHIKLNDNKYKLVRKFNSEDSGLIVVHDIDKEDTFSLFINRKLADNNFSDWLLDKLGIPKIKLYQGIRPFIFGFNDLFRLMYHNQLSDSFYIHKLPDGKSNFVNDSLEIRKTIFEVLTSNVSFEYYNTINQVKIAENKVSIKQEYLNTLRVTNEEVNHEFGKVNSNHLNKQISKLKLKEMRINDEIASYQNTTVNSNNDEINELKNQIYNLQKEQVDARYRYQITIKELEEFYLIHKLQSNEIKNIERIIVSSDYLGIFNATTCPICGQEAKERHESKCICGADIEEDKYQDFFYTKNDYNNILKTKKVAIETTQKAIDYSSNELKTIEKRMEELSELIDTNRMLLYKLVSDTPEEKVFRKIKRLNESLFDVKNDINSLEVSLNMLEKYEAERIKLEDLIQKRDEAITQQKLAEINYRSKMKDIIASFSEIYEGFLKNADSEINNAKIDYDYNPIVNDGYYRNVASKVSRRLFYFFSLLKLSIDSEIPFPRFLLVDTPQNFGIDAKALRLIFDEIEKFCVDNDDSEFQVILTIKDDFVNHLKNIKPKYHIDDNSKLLISKVN